MIEVKLKRVGKRLVRFAPVGDVLQRRGEGAGVIVERLVAGPQSNRGQVRDVLLCSAAFAVSLGHHLEVEVSKLVEEGRDVVPLEEDDLHRLGVKLTKNAPLPCGAQVGVGLSGSGCLVVRRDIHPTAPFPNTRFQLFTGLLSYEFRFLPCDLLAVH